MKGFVEYLIQMNAQLERELERDSMGLEVPYMKDSYCDWLQKKDGKKENVAKSYISYLKSVDSEFFLGEDDFFEQLRDCVENGNPDRMNGLFDRYSAIIDDWLGYSEKEDIGISAKTIRDWRSGFRSYRKFMTELCKSGNRCCNDGLCDSAKSGQDGSRIPDWEEITDREIEEAVAKARGMANPVGTPYVCYGIRELKRKFRLRFVTQDRMGYSKQVFYPIGLLLRLFRKTGQFDWLNGWIYANVDNIRILTDRGEKVLSDLDETCSLCIDTVSGDVTVTLKTGEVLPVMTRTHIGGGEPVLMKARDISEIHIDHTALISTVLENMKDQLPAMVKLTDIIKNMSENEGVDIKSSNFTLLENLVMDTCFTDMAEMIPDFEHELELIRSKTELKLMSSVYNLKKKK